MVSFIIPLKIILLLSAQQMPQSLSSYMAFGTLNEWVVFLSLMTVCAYLVSIGFFYCAKVATRRGSQKVRASRQSEEESWSSRKTREVVLFYKLFSESLADFILAAICLCVVGLVNVKVFFFILAVLLAVLFVLSFLYRYDALRDVFFGDKSNFLVQYVCQGAFFAIFLFMIFNYLLWTPIDPILAMVTLIVSRRMVSASERFFKKITRINKLDHRAVAALDLKRVAL